MEMTELSEYFGLLYIIVFMLMWIFFSLTTKQEIHYRCRIPKWMNFIFWNKAKNGTVPFLSLAITIGLYATVPILLAIKYFNPKVDLDILTFYYLVLPWILIVAPAMIVLEGLASFKKKKRIKAEEEARIKMKKDNWIANNVKKKKKK
jgi:hypothetical protein